MTDKNFFITLFNNNGSELLNMERIPPIGKTKIVFTCNKCKIKTSKQWVKILTDPTKS